MPEISILIWKILVIVCIVSASLTVVCWKLKNYPSWQRKPLVVVLFGLLCIPQLVISLMNGNIFTRQFWKDKRTNFMIAWYGHKKNGN